MSFDLNQLLRANIAELTPYSSARDEFEGEASILLDANENPYKSDVNRYPDPHQRKLKNSISRIMGTKPENTFLGNGSDEGIDLLFRAFCEPGKDNVVSIDPSYGMYKVCADIQAVEFRKVLLYNDFSLNVKALLDAADSNTKLIFLCSPNNPTSNLLDRKDILQLIQNFKGMIVLDEAYIDFSETNGMLPELTDYPNLCILRTFSKAWGMAGIRLGMVFGSVELIRILTKIKYPYNLNVLSQEFAIHKLKEPGFKTELVQNILGERDVLQKKLRDYSFIEKVFPSDANFLLLRTKDPKGLYRFLVNKEIIVRDRSGLPLCEGCLRITIGTREENKSLLSALSEYKIKNLS